MNIRNERSKRRTWMLHKADWASFTSELEHQAIRNQTETARITDINSFTELIIGTTEKYITKTSEKTSNKKNCSLVG